MSVVYRTNEDTPEAQPHYTYIDVAKMQTEGSGLKDEGYDDGKSCKHSEGNWNRLKWVKCPAKRMVFCIGMATALVLVIIAIAIVLVLTSSENHTNTMDDIPRPKTTKTPDGYDVTMIKGQQTHGPSRKASLFVIGGNRKTEMTVTQNTVDVYEIASGNIRWSHQGKPSPVPLYRAGKAVRGQFLYIMGGVIYGNNTWKYQNETAIYDMSSYTWTILPGLSGAWYGRVLFVHGNTLYSVYGSGRSVKSLNREDTSQGWKSVPITIPHKIYGINTVIQIKDTIFMFSRDLTWSTSVLSWNPSIKESRLALTTVRDLNVARLQLSMCVVSEGIELIWVFAGCRDCWEEGFIEQFNISSQTWTKINTVPDIHFQNKNHIHAHICGYFDGMIYLVFSDGGGEFDKRFHLFDTVELVWTVFSSELKTEAYSPVSIVIPP